MLTTHVPGLANQLDTDSIRYLKLNGDGPQVNQGEEILDDVADTLGVLPNPLEKVQVIMYVEGKHDIAFFEHLSNIVSQEHPELPDIKNDKRVAIIPAGGASLKDWINEQYLKDLNKPEIHIYDGDVEAYQEEIQKVNEREDESIGMQTQRYEMEDYIPAHIFEDHYNHYNITIDKVRSDEDIVERVSKAVYLAQENDEDLWPKHRKNFHDGLKRTVERDLLPLLTYQDLEEMGTLEEIKGWFDTLNELLEG